MTQEELSKLDLSAADELAEEMSRGFNKSTETLSTVSSMTDSLFSAPSSPTSLSTVSSTTDSLDERDFKKFEVDPDVDLIDSEAYTQQFMKLRASALAQWQERQRLYQDRIPTEVDIEKGPDYLHQEESSIENADKLVGPIGLAGVVSKTAYEMPAEVEFLMKGPKAWIEAVEHLPELVQKAQTAADVVASMGMAAVATPMVVKSIVTGWQDFQSGRHTVAEMERKIPELEKNLQDLKETAHLLPEEMTKAAQTMGETQLKEIKSFLERAKNNKKIGIGEMFSGSAILIKSTMAATSKIATLAAANSGTSAATLGAVGTLATAAGAANMILGPVAGGIITYTGVKKYKASDEKVKYLTEIVPKTSAFLEKAVKEDETLEEYKGRVEKKLNQRIDFYRRSKHMNLHLAVSGALFGSASAGSGVIALATLAGAGALASNPITAGIVASGVGSASVYLAASAVYNMVTAPKHRLYNKTMEGNAPGINKDFLASLDSMALTAPEQLDEFLGVQTRADISQSQARCNEIVQDLLHENGTGKPYLGLYIHSTDSPEVVEKRVAQDASSGENPITGKSKNILVKQKQATWDADSTGARIKKPFVTVGNLYKGPKFASMKGKEAYAKSASYLTKTGYANHLKDPNTDNTKVFEKMGEVMAEQAKAYDAVIESSLKVFPVSLNLLSENLEKELAQASQTEAQSSPELQEKMKLALAIYKRVAEAGDKNIAEQTMKYIKLLELAKTFKDMSTGAANPTDPEKAQAIEAYMALRQDQMPDEEIEDHKLEKPDEEIEDHKLKKSFESLASFLMEEEPKIYRLQKGTMPFVETYTTSMRLAMEQSLSLDKTAKTEISQQPESPEELKTKLSMSYQEFTGKSIGSDDKRKSKLLSDFNEANKERTAQGDSPLSVDEYIKQKYKDRQKKTLPGENKTVDRPNKVVAKGSHR